MKKVFAVLLAVLILGSLVLPVFAEDSPGGTTKYKIEIYYHLDDVVFEGSVIVEEGGQYTFIPKDKEGFEFDYYVINGLYDLIQGNKDGDKFTTKDGVTIVPKEDLVIDVYFKNVTPPPTPPSDNNPTSPSTGSNAWVFVALIAVGLAGAFVATRKLAKSHG